MMQFLFAPVIVNLSDRYGRRPILLASIICLALVKLIWAIAWSYSMLFIGRRLLSRISGASFAIFTAYLADISDDKTRPHNFGLLGVASALGFILGSFIGGFLGQFGPRIPFYFASGFSLINFIFAWVMLTETLSVWNRRLFDIKRANPLGALSVWLSIWTFMQKNAMIGVRLLLGYPIVFWG